MDSDETGPPGEDEKQKGAAQGANCRPQNTAADNMYVQWCEDFRALQTVFWRVPFFAMTITGGLGAAVIAFDGPPEIKRLLLVFSAICNSVLILIAWRVRKTMESLLKKIFRYEGVEKPKTGFFVLKCFSALFAGVAIALISAAAFFPDSWLSQKLKDARAGSDDSEAGIVEQIILIN